MRRRAGLRHLPALHDPSTLDTSPTRQDRFPLKGVWLLVVSLALVGGLALLRPAGPAAAVGPARVVASDAAGHRVAALPLGRGASFALAYRHSLERAPAEERYVAERRGGGFRLVAIASPDAGVLDYYELEGRRAVTRKGLRVLTLARPVLFAAGMDLAASAHGRRTLVAGAEREALYPRRGAAHLRIRVEGS